MPTLNEATNYDTSKFESVQRPQPPSMLSQQTYPLQPDPFLRATVPQIGIAGPDSQRSFFNGGKVPQTRIPILNQLGTPFN